MGFSGSPISQSVADIDSRGLWSVTLPPCSTMLLKPGFKLFIRNAALGFELQNRDTNTPHEVSLTYMPSGQTQNQVHVLLWTFYVYYAESFSSNIELEKGVEYKLEHRGSNAVDIIGYFDDSDCAENSKPGLTCIAISQYDKTRINNDNPAKPQAKRLTRAASASVIGLTLGANGKPV